MRLTARIFLVGSGYNGFAMTDPYDCHVFLIDGKDELAILDVGAGMGVPEIVENIRYDGFDPGQIRHMILSHAHGDHAGGAAKMRAALDNAPYTRVVFQGKAEIVEGPTPRAGLTLEVARRMAVRYLDERGPEYLEPSQPRPRYLIKLVPDKVTSWEGVEWHSKYLEENT